MYITHYSITSDNRMKRRSLPWNFWMWQAEWGGGETRGRKRKMAQSAHHLRNWHELSSTSQRAATFKSPPIDSFDIAQGITHLLFHTSVMVQLASSPASLHCPPPFNTHTQTNRKNTHTRARTNIRFSFLPVPGWNDYWRLGLYLKCVGTEKKMRCRWQLGQFGHKHFFHRRTQERATSGALLPYMMYGPFIWRFFW